MKKKMWPYYLYLAFIAFILLTPIIVTFIYSITTGWAKMLPSGWTLDHWKRLFFEEKEFWAAMGRSILISIFPIFLSGLCVILAMYAAILYFPWLDTVIQSISMVPFTLKGVVLAISVLGLYAGKGLIFSNRIVMLICIYCVVVLPFVYRGIRNNLYAVNVQQLIEAASLLGASKLYTFMVVIVPNMLSGIIVSALLAFASIFTDYAVIKIIAGSRYITAQAQLYTINRTVGGPFASCVVIVIFSTTLIISVLSYRLQSERKGKKSVKKEKQ